MRFSRLNRMGTKFLVSTQVFLKQKLNLLPWALLFSKVTIQVHQEAFHMYNKSSLLFHKGTLLSSLFPLNCIFFHLICYPFISIQGIKIMMLQMTVFSKDYFSFDPKAVTVSCSINTFSKISEIYFSCTC